MATGVPQTSIINRPTFTPRSGPIQINRTIESSIHYFFAGPPANSWVSHPGGCSCFRTAPGNSFSFHGFMGSQLHAFQHVTGSQNCFPVRSPIVLRRLLRHAASAEAGNHQTTSKRLQCIGCVSTKGHLRHVGLSSQMKLNAGFLLRTPFQFLGQQRFCTS